MNCGGGLGAGKNGDDGPGDAENEEPCDDALAFVLQLSDFYGAGRLLFWELS